MLFTIIAIFFALYFAGLLGFYIGSRLNDRWNYCADILPPKTVQIQNYPVAFYDAEFGIVVDQADYHPTDPIKWRSVPNGTPCRPFAWYSLPPAPVPRLPQDRAFRMGVNDHI